MADLPLDQAVARFQENEERIDKFVNAPNGEDEYETSEGQRVPVLPKLLPAVTVQADRAANEANRATAAVETAMLDALIAANTAQGLALTDPEGADGKPVYFRIFSPEDEESFVYYRHDVGGIAAARRAGLGRRADGLARAAGAPGERRSAGGRGRA